MTFPGICAAVAAGDIAEGATAVICVETRDIVAFDKLADTPPNPFMWVWWFPDSPLAR